jgi:hypothetical protein
MVKHEGNPGLAGQADQPPTGQKSTAKRLLWFVGLWGAGVLALTAVSQMIRWAIMP